MIPALHSHLWTSCTVLIQITACPWATASRDELPLINTPAYSVDLP
jgi:hypothetical protein